MIHNPYCRGPLTSAMSFSSERACCAPLIYYTNAQVDNEFGNLEVMNNTHSSLTSWKHISIYLRIPGSEILRYLRLILLRCSGGCAVSVRQRDVMTLAPGMRPSNLLQKPWSWSGLFLLRAVPSFKVSWGWSKAKEVLIFLRQLWGIWGLRQH